METTEPDDEYCDASGFWAKEVDGITTSIHLPILQPGQAYEITPRAMKQLLEADGWTKLVGGHDA